ncbi:MAG: ECF transporter S component [Clostridia bacterium]|nr:ECF transporter S component [Clostridia bacterium]
MSTKSIASQRKLSVKNQTLATLVAIVASVALPQFFHLLGAASGLGTSLGEVFLPMHLPVILVGLFAGPMAGALTGAVSPMISFALTGMPVAAMLPFMVIELFAYGIVAGLLREVKMPCVAKVFAVQIIGRVVRLVAILFAIHLLGKENMNAMSVLYSVKTGLFGLVLQWTMIPLILYRVENR